MKQLFSYLRQVDRVWKFIWIFIFCGFMILDITFPHFFGATLLKLFGIALCFIFVLQKYNEDRRLLLAFALTFIADILLTINNFSLFGLFVFILAQFVHFIRLKYLNHSACVTGIIILCIIFVLSVLLGDKAIFPLGATYAFFLIANIFLAYRWKQRVTSKKGAKRAYPASTKRAAYFAFYGFVLFAFCDFCAASSFFVTISFLPFFIKHLFDFFCWAFYYPSQVLISNSGRKPADDDLAKQLT